MFCTFLKTVAAGFRVQSYLLSANVDQLKEG
jgi:hypothetical protein